MDRQPVKQLLLQRAGCFNEIRHFFQRLGVLEVDTRLLDRFSVTDPYMSAFKVINPDGSLHGFLQTSPEYAMKQLLAGGSGDIFQLNKAFRADEKGANHDAEFTMLEWYRAGFSLEQLIDEVHSLICQIAGQRELRQVSYRQIFLERLNIDPLTISDLELARLTRKKLAGLPQQLIRDNYLSLLFSEIIEPALAVDQVTAIYHYPASQASLAKVIQHQGHAVAERFEIYCGGFELANGFHELTEVKEQASRFEQDNRIRNQLGYPQMAIDQRLLNALEQGIPDCSGVALGVDRLLMIKLQQTNISDVLPLG